MKKLITLLAVLWSVSAAAQTYVRPSVGKALTVVDRMPITSDNGVSVTSAVYDWTAFRGVQVNVVASTNITDCIYLPVISVQGATTATGVYALLSDDGAMRTISEAQPGTANAATYLIGYTMPYLKVLMESASGSGQQICSFTVTLVPIPFAETMQVRGAFRYGSTPSANIFPVLTGALSTQGLATVVQSDQNGNLSTIEIGSSRSPSWGTVTVAATATRINTSSAPDFSMTHFMVQNQSTSVVFCGTANTVTTTNYAFTLAAASSAANGTGGSATFSGVGYNATAIYCIVATGSANVSYMNW